MKVVVLAGGRGTRLSEETSVRPKPMVEVGGKPILWHIMHIYAHYGFREFVVACGFKAEIIKKYFLNFYLHNNDYSVNLQDGSRELLNAGPIDWRVSVVDTGLDTLTGGRVLRLKNFLRDAAFMVTYGDGVGNVDIGALAAFHRSHGKLATVTAVRPPARFGALQLDGQQVTRFAEKPQTEGGWINGGFFVFEPGVFDFLKDDNSTLEGEPLERLARDGELMAFMHEGFWQPMDTLRDRQMLDTLWATEKAPWMLWK
jgi:glucose-1-phosphate cytidylyltransferase